MRMYNYKSPIESTMLQVKSDIEKRLEDTTYKAVIECGVAVDKDELIKALTYDRGQYEKGFADGYRAAKAEIVRCKDCKWWEDEICTNANGAYKNLIFNPNWYCASGERKDYGQINARMPETAGRTSERTVRPTGEDECAGHS